MSIFVDKNHRRKSPIAIAAFFAAAGYLCVYLVLYALLAEPLYRHVALSSAAATNAVHTLIVAVIGTALCCLLFLLPDKRVAAYGFAGLAVVLVMFYIAAFLMDADQRGAMLQLITLHGLAPALVGNAAAWPIYLRLRRTHPLPERKTLRQEIQETAARSGGTVAPKKAEEPAGDGEPSEEEAGVRRQNTPQDDAALLYGVGEDDAG